MISPFEYITVLISIILGMGITEILSGVGNVVLRWDRVKSYWVHTILVLLVFILHFQEWWVIFELRYFEAWRLPVFLFIILYPVNLYLLARILFPLKWKATGTNLREFYYDNCRKIFLFIFSLAVLSVLDNTFLHDISFGGQIPQITLALLSVTILIVGKRSVWVHQAVVICLLLITVAALAVEWDVLLISNK